MSYCSSHGPHVTCFERIVQTCSRHRCRSPLMTYIRRVSVTLHGIKLIASSNVYSTNLVGEWVAFHLDEAKHVLLCVAVGGDHDRGKKLPDLRSPVELGTCRTEEEGSTRKALPKRNTELTDTINICRSMDDIRNCPNRPLIRLTVRQTYRNED